MPLVIAALIIGGLAFGTYKFLKVKQDAGYIIPDLKPRIFKIDFSQIIIAVDVVIKNPTELKLYIIKPFLTLAYKNNAIVSSEVSDDIIRIDPFQSTKPFTILIPIKFLSVTSAATELLKKLQDKNAKTNFQIVIISKIVRNVADPVPPRLRDFSKTQMDKMNLIGFKDTKDVSI